MNILELIIESLEYLYYGIPIPLRVAYFLWLVFISLYWYASKHDEYNSKLISAEKEEKINFNISFQLVGVSIVLLNQLLLWFDINPNDIINTKISDDVAILNNISSNVQEKYEDKYIFLITYLLPSIGLIIMFYGLRMAALARAVINGYWNPNIVIYTDKNNQKLKTNGIYSRLRHPIYVSQFLLAFGTAIAGTSYLLLLFPLIIALINLRRARNEDKELEQIFGSEFTKYKDSVSSCGLYIR
ncbi:methyltransferase family protein [Sulfurimonas sp.]|uniref:methyltransferase family protein n=1 Tax=Sulfurimonas sp. TaxID=2022749 RepID=UPI003D0C0AC5